MFWDHTHSVFIDTAGTGGFTYTGNADGGNGGGRGSGGNAYTGPTGNADGGAIENVGTSNVNNMMDSSKYLPSTSATRVSYFSR